MRAIGKYILPVIFGAFIFLITPMIPALLNNTDRIPVKHIVWFSGLRALEISPIAMFSILIIGGSAGALSKFLIGDIKDGKTIRCNSY